jgi:hypothetical protein
MSGATQSDTGVNLNGTHRPRGFFGNFGHLADGADRVQRRLTACVKCFSYTNRHLCLSSWIWTRLSMKSKLGASVSSLQLQKSHGHLRGFSVNARALFLLTHGKADIIARHMSWIPKPAALCSPKNS